MKIRITKINYKRYCFDIPRYVIIENETRNYLVKTIMSRKSNAVTDISKEDFLVINLERLMQKENLTEAELARNTGIPQPTIHKILSGTTEDPRISTMQLLADFFGISIDELLSSTPVFSKKDLAFLNIKSIPIISWEDCIRGTAFLKNLNANNWSKWTVIEHKENYLYGLLSKPSMEPRFPKGSLLIVDSHALPKDGDIVVVYYLDTSEATLRELTIDGPTKCLASIQDMAPKPKEPLSNEICIIGSVIESRFEL